MRDKIVEIEDYVKDWDSRALAIKVGRNYLTIICIKNTNPLLEGDIGTFTLFDIEELDNKYPPVARVKIGTIFKIERFRDIIHFNESTGLEFETEEQVKIFKEFVSRNKRSKYII